MSSLCHIYKNAHIQSKKDKHKLPECAQLESLQTASLKISCVRTDELQVLAQVLYSGGERWRIQQENATLEVVTPISLLNSIVELLMLTTFILAHHLKMEL